MHLNTKKIAFAGVMLALTEVGIALGSVIETNTLFLLAAALYNKKDAVAIQRPFLSGL